MTEEEGNPSPTKRIAAIDLGTNSFHAVIVDIYSDGSFRTIDKLKEMVILAEKGMENHLSEDAMQRGIEGLKRIKFLCDSHNVEKILAYATSAIREADNGGDFIQRIGEEVGIIVRAISGKMEAEMIAYAIRHSIALDKEMVLMVDIGGGSVEFIVGNIDSFIHFSSLKLGVARMAAQFVDSDPISEKEVSALSNHYKKELKSVAAVLKDHPVVTMIGSSGTMENIATMVINSKKSSAEPTTLNELLISPKDFHSFYKDFIMLEKTERLKVKGLEEKRVAIINPGMVLVKFLIDEFNIENIKISEGALRDGMILNFIEKEKGNADFQLVADFPEPRKRSIYELLRKCSWAEKHSTHVANLALQIFDTFKEELKLEDTDRELLEFATLMHDIGYYISHRKHHKHALYIIQNSELRGFREQEINLMANVARYHRNSPPHKGHEEYKRLDKSVKKRVKKLSGILRVADGLDRSHYQNVKELKILNGKKKVSFKLVTESDPELEIWGALHKSDLFEKVTGKKLEIDVK